MDSTLMYSLESLKLGQLVALNPGRETAVKYCKHDAWLRVTVRTKLWHHFLSLSMFNWVHCAWWWKINLSGMHHTTYTQGLFEDWTSISEFFSTQHYYFFVHSWMNGLTLNWCLVKLTIQSRLVSINNDFHSTLQIQ